MSGHHITVPCLPFYTCYFFHLQPAIYVASLAAVEKLRATEGQALLDSVDVAAGLSLGEYTALAFAGGASRFVTT